MMAHAPRTPFAPVDLLRFEFLSDPQVSPDGSRVAFVRSVIDPKRNKYRRAIMVAPVPPPPAGGGAAGPGPAAAFTSGVHADTWPRWSPDGRYLAFLSTRDPGPGEDEDKRTDAQLWILPAGGGEARPVTAVKGGGGVTAFVWSPDSRFIAFVAAVKPGGLEWLEDKGPADAAGPEQDLEALFKKYNKDVKHITRVFYRLDGVGYLEDRRTQVFLLDVEAALTCPPGTGPSLRPLPVTTGDFDHANPAFSPDGRFIAVDACRDANADLQRYRDIWVFAVPDGAASGSPPGRPAAAGEPKRLTERTGPFHSPAWSPDGGRLAFLGHEREKSWYSNDRVWVVEVGPDGSPGGKPRCLTRDFDRSFADDSLTDMRALPADPRPRWSPDGRTLYGVSSDRGTTHLMAVDVATGRVSQLTGGDRVVFGWSADAAARVFAFSVSTPESPSDIYVGRLPEPASPSAWPAAPTGPEHLGLMDLVPLTRANTELLDHRAVSPAERFTFRASGGPACDGWVIRPVGFEEGRTYPAVLQIHGGPMSMYTGAFFFEFQLLAAAGIGVVFTNPRGSQGYGEDFCAGIREEWGQNDYADLMAGLEEALRRHPWIDAGRLGVAGGSYGGYMTSWIIGHTDRFRAACSMRAVNNCHSFFGTSDIGFLWDEIWHGTPWENADNLLRQSPISYAGNVKTPTLIIHSEEDHRCLVEQGEQMFTALKKLGVETELIRYPEESHGLSRAGKPWHRVHRLKTIVEWFARKLEEG